MAGPYEVRLAKQTGGKAGKGRNKTSTMQIIKHLDNNLYEIVYQTRFNLADFHSYQAALSRANAICWDFNRKYNQAKEDNNL